MSRSAEQTLANVAGGLKPRPARALGAAVKGATPAAAVLCLLLALAEPARAAPAGPRSRWPRGAVVVPFENLEGAVVVTGCLVAEAGAATPAGTAARRDTTGPFILDTGAGYLALDAGLALELGLVESGVSGLDAAGVALATRPVGRLDLGPYAATRLSPVLLFDARVVRRAIDRPVLGLLGRQVVGNASLIVDYEVDSLAIAGTSAGPGRGEWEIPFDLVGDAKVVLKASVAGGPPADFILDTGATKCVLFERMLPAVAPRHPTWPSLRGLTAPTVAGDVPVRLVRLPSLRVGERGPAVDSVEAGVGAAALGEQLARVTGRPVAGLIGYSYLKRFRVTIDYARHRLVLRRIGSYRERRPFEFVHVGLQLARSPRGVEVVGIAQGSPAAEAGIAHGDLVSEVDTLRAEHADLLSLARVLEGPADSVVRVVISRGDEVRVLRLKRRRLL